MLNYRHLYYFWMVAKEGGMARAADRLGVAIQTISAQVRLLEQDLGHQLLKPKGRGVALTEAGEAAFARAEEIFQIGQTLPQVVHAAATSRHVRLAVGLSEGISKLAAHAMLKPVLDIPGAYLTFHEGEVEALLGALALQQLDVVLAGQGAPANPNLRVASDRLVASSVDWYGPARLVTADAVRTFPLCLQGLPLLLPTGHSPLRLQLDRWLSEKNLQATVAGEFQDSALMAVFAAQGMGVFPVSRLGARALTMIRGMKWLGQTDEVREEIHAIRNRRGQLHPLVQRILQQPAPG